MADIKSPSVASFPALTFRRESDLSSPLPLFPDPGRWPRPPPIPVYHSDGRGLNHPRGSSDSDMSEISEQGLIFFPK
jgi:hypothetical protein